MSTNASNSATPTNLYNKNKEEDDEFITAFISSLFKEYKVLRELHGNAYKVSIKDLYESDLEEVLFDNNATGAYLGGYAIRLLPHGAKNFVAVADDHKVKSTQRDYGHYIEITLESDIEILISDTENGYHV